MTQRDRGSVGQRLLQERLARNWSQERLAEALETSTITIRRWEHDIAFPQARFREQLCRLFERTNHELFGSLEENEPASLWMVPFPRNPFFTGREEVLEHLHGQFHQEHMIALTQSWAVSGLGGIGKTQIALEYAYRYRQSYRFVFWVHAAIQETLLADFSRMADLLQLPERTEHEQEKVVQAVKQWLATHQGWLCILDNADDLALLRDFVPAELAGHLLLTSRAQALGALAQPIEVETLGMAEGTLFLLRRTRLLPPGAPLEHIAEEQLSAAEAIVLAMDFLPLALDQAGAYIEETGCGLRDYLELYRTHRQDLLRRRGYVPTDHPESVATTWSLAFQKIERSNPAAAELLRLCAFLEPDTIPEELVSNGGTRLGAVLAQVAGDAYRLNEAIEELRRFSLLQRSPETKMLRVHRLVQVVLKDALGLAVQRQWVERAIQLVNSAFPREVGPETWAQCQRILPQAQACSVLIQDYALMDLEAAALLSRTARYLQEQALYEQAEPLYQRALAIREQVLGRTHPEVASALNNLAILYRRQGKYKQAEPLYQRTLAIREQILGGEHPTVARSLSNLALLYAEQGEYEQAEPLYLRALSIWEQALVPEHPDITRLLNNLGLLYAEQGKYEQAEPLYLRALAIREQALGPEHPDIAPPFCNLADLYSQQGRYAEAELLYKRATRIWEQALGPEHPDIAHPLNGLANLYRDQGRGAEAEQLYGRALSLREKVLGQQHVEIAQTLHDLAGLYRKQGKDEQAEPLLARALAMCEEILGQNHPTTQTVRASNAALLQAREQHSYQE